MGKQGRKATGAVLFSLACFALAAGRAHAAEGSEDPAVVYVEPETRSLHALSQATLDWIVDWLKAGDARVAVVGPDPGWAGARDFDATLELRAVALVRDALVAEGIAPKRVKLIKGTTAPEPRGWSRNRLVVYLKPRDFPWAPAGQEAPANIANEVDEERTRQQAGLAPPAYDGVATPAPTSTP